MAPPPSTTSTTAGPVTLTMPRLSDSMTEGTILKWLVSEGDEIESGQPLVEIETDKAAVTHESEHSGTVLRLVAAEGETVAVSAPIAVIGEAGADASAADALPPAAAEGAAATSERPGNATPASAADRASAAAPEHPAAAGPAAAAERPKASPLARRIAARAGLELVGLAGSGPQGRVIRADVERALSIRPATGSDEHEVADVHELTRLQRTVARRMSESRSTVPDIELRRQVDMTACVNLRSKLRELDGDLPTYNDFVIKAAAAALRDFPRVNSRYRDDRFEHLPRVNVGFAVAAQDALVVPTVFDADRKSLGQIAGETRALAARVREGTITPAELDGATFTVSNLGMHGVDSFSAIINVPQAAILTVGSLRPRPVVDAGGEVVARPTVMLSLACDHRILYGADGARFLGRVTEYLEQPLGLLLG